MEQISAGLDLSGPSPALARPAVEGARGNAFDFIRVAAALAVLFSHSLGLYGRPQPMIFGDTLGRFAVAVFFCISGYLICQSWDRDPNLWRFAARRGLRILPGLLAAVAFTAFVAGAIDTRLPLGAYFASRGTWAYVLSNATLIGGIATLPGAFEGLPHPGPANGSLWTLTYEAVMYGVLALLGLSRRFKALCVLVFVSCTAAWALAQHHGIADYQLPLPLVWKVGLAIDGCRIATLGAYFFGGSLLYLFARKVPLSPVLAALCLVAAALAPPAGAAIALAVGVPYATITLARRLPRRATNLGGWDLSYGIYVYAYPIQQLTTRFCISRGLDWPAALAIETVVVLALATFSWVVVEKPALSLKDGLRTRERAFDRVSSRVP